MSVEAYTLWAFYRVKVVIEHSDRIYCLKVGIFGEDLDLALISLCLHGHLEIMCAGVCFSVSKMSHIS